MSIGDSQPFDQYTTMLLDILEARILARIGKFTNSKGQIDLKKAGGLANKLPGKHGGNKFIDHGHSGAENDGQQLVAANTHLEVVLGPLEGAIHWNRAAIVALILDNIPDDAGFDPLTDLLPAGDCHPSGTLPVLLDDLFCRMRHLETAQGGFGLAPFGTSPFGG